MIPENHFKEQLIDRLNQINPCWIDGDTENRDGKKVDIVNHYLKIALEIKDDTRHRINIPSESGVMVDGGEDLTKMNQRFDDHIRSANRKFREYTGYKTILLFRTEFFITDIIRYAIEGLHTYKYVRGADNLMYSGRVSKYSKNNRKEVGCFLVFDREASYFPNQAADGDRVVEKSEVSSIFGMELKDIQQV